MPSTLRGLAEPSSATARNLRGKRRLRLGSSGTGVVVGLAAYAAAPETVA
jgi:hypothetical protein